ncbi:MAG: diguanylate cyclase [Bermanella sp.]
MREVKTLTILVVEDNPGDFDLISEYLSEVNWVSYELIPCSSLQQAKEKLLVNTLDAVLLDLSLPDSSGIGTVSNMRSLSDRLPIIVLTGLDNDEIGEQSIQQGAQEYLAKNELNGRLLSRVIKYAIKRKQMDLKLEKLAITDPLTELYNRRYFFERGWNEYVRARRYEHALAIVMMDIDYFKKVNDFYGHICGDKVLVSVANLLRKTVRGIDLVSRFGGEEFIVLIPETDLKGVQLLAERMRLEVADTPIEHNGKSFHISISIGVAMIDSNNGDFEGMINQADIALYKAKDKGRNRVELYNNSLNDNNMPR